MKTLIIAWAIGISLYTVTSVVNSQERDPADYIDIWTGFTGDRVCLSVKDGVDQTAARAELWMVNNFEVQWVEDIVGYGCVEIDLHEDSVLQAITYDPRIEIRVIEGRGNMMLTRL